MSDGVDDHRRHRLLHALPVLARSPDHALPLAKSRQRKIRTPQKMERVGVPYSCSVEPIDFGDVIKVEWELPWEPPNVAAEAG